MQSLLLRTQIKLLEKKLEKKQQNFLFKAMLKAAITLLYVLLTKTQCASHVINTVELNLFYLTSKFLKIFNCRTTNLKIFPWQFLQEDCWYVVVKKILLREAI